MLDFHGFPEANSSPDLIQILDVTPIPDTSRFTALNQWMPHGRIFGGQVLAQGLVAALHTVPSGRMPHSVHGYFLRAGDITKRIEYESEVLRDGKSFSARRVQAFQDGVPIFSMIASFQDLDVGLAHQHPEVAVPIDVPSPEELPEPSEHFADQESKGFTYWAESRPFEIRHCEGPLYLKPAEPKLASQSVWIRSKVQLPVTNPGLHLAALLFASDYSILEPILRVHGLPWLHPGLSTASLDHAIWIYDKINVNDWLLYRQESPISGHGRGLSMGKIYTRDGRLVASVAQEGMIRVPELR
jgi:acyl-CoA thioesterase-2